MKRILCLGDSNTFGYDPRSHFGSRYPSDVRWTGRLRAAGWEIVNLGQNGLSIPQKRQLPAVADALRGGAPWDAVTILLGSNDLLNGASAEETALRMEPLLRCVAENAEGGRVVLIAPPPMRPGEWVREERLPEESARLAGLYRRLADKQGVAFADAGVWNVALAYDGVHFTPEGHAAFAAGLSDILSRP